MLELIVDKGCLRPAGSRDIDALRKMQLGLGQIVQAKIHQPRNPRFFRLAHQLGQLVRQNIEGFELLDGHQVLKRLQIESGVQCDEMQVRVPGVGPALVRFHQALLLPFARSALGCNFPSIQTIYKPIACASCP